MEAGSPQVRVGADNVTLGPVVVDLGGIPPTETSYLIYLQDIIHRLNTLNEKVNYLVAQHNLTRWERILRWLGIH